jgi:hypothetical protein
VALPSCSQSQRYGLLYSTQTNTVGREDYSQVSLESVKTRKDSPVQTGLSNEAAGTPDCGVLPLGRSMPENNLANSAEAL